MTSVQKNNNNSLHYATLAEMEYWLYPHENEDSITPQTLNDNSEFSLVNNNRMANGKDSIVPTNKSNIDISKNNKNEKVPDNSFFNENYFPNVIDNNNTFQDNCLNNLSYFSIEPKDISYLDSYNFLPSNKITDNDNNNNNTSHVNNSSSLIDNMDLTNNIWNNDNINRNKNRTISPIEENIQLVPNFFSSGLEALPTFKSDLTYSPDNVESGLENKTLKDDTPLDDLPSIDSNWNRADRNSLITSEVSLNDSTNQFNNKVISPLQTPPMRNQYGQSKDIDYFSLPQDDDSSVNNESNTSQSNNSVRSASISIQRKESVPKISKSLIDGNITKNNGSPLVSPTFNRRNSRNSRRSSVMSSSTNSDEDGCNRYPCNICGKIFKRPSSLGTHMNIHTGFKPFVCPYIKCHKSFNAKSNMLRHYKLHFKLPNGKYKYPNGKVTVVAPTTKELFDSNDQPKPIRQDC